MEHSIVLKRCGVGLNGDWDSGWRIPVVPNSYEDVLIDKELVDYED